MLAGVGNTMCATTTFAVVVFPSDLWGHISAGVGMLGMVRSTMWHLVPGPAGSSKLDIAFFMRMTLVGARS
jgi:hypothetical protein